MTQVWKCSPLSMFIKMICFEGYNYYSLNSPTHVSAEAEICVSTLNNIANPEHFIQYNQYWILIILWWVATFHLIALKAEFNVLQSTIWMLYFSTPVVVGDTLPL